ncbi:MAG: Nif3-like dinuclear metal center hexameric protein [Planctomycetota bacterium]|jgi:dinuclear metal center YbgI/SA1388 family protein|nr:Nif3-like dinuclear metal center hexameric protein [Planctomycetota bacterium]
MGGIVRVGEVVEAMEGIAPPALALAGDGAGLQAGDPGAKVGRILVCLDASLPALARAGGMGAQMLVSHHPRFYRGLDSLAGDRPAGRRAAALAASGLAVYSAHTSLDLAEGGVNDCLARAAGLEGAGVIKPEKRERLVKLAVFVPAERVEEVRAAVCRAGAGAIGKYSECTFRTRGTGTFRCGPETKPFQGRPGSFEEADEYRLETVFGEFSAPRVVAAMLAAHPYEEVAYDLYPLRGTARVYGFGRAGSLPGPEPLAKLAARLARVTASRMTQYFGRPDRPVRRLGVWAGGGLDVGAALAAGVEALAVGEIGYHEVEDLADAGVSLVVLGHGCSERPVLRPLARRLRAALGNRVKVDVMPDAGFSLRNAGPEG